MTRLALWLAELTDRWARRVTGDDLAERLAQAEEDIDAWEVDQGELINTYCRILLLDEARARRRHPAGSRLT